jgi:hypothetical protein
VLHAEVNNAGSWNAEVLQAFEQRGYRCFRLLPGPKLLVPFTPATEEMDPYLLNLFAFKAEHEAALAQRGLLLRGRNDAPEPVLSARVRRPLRHPHFPAIGLGFPVCSTFSGHGIQERNGPGQQVRRLLADHPEAAHTLLRRPLYWTMLSAWGVATDRDADQPPAGQSAEVEGAETCAHITPCLPLSILALE